MEEDDNPNPPAVAIITPPTEPPESEEGESEGEEIAAIAARIDAVETRITEGLEGERTWTQETITSLRQELADLKATLAAVAENHPAAMQALRDELIRLSQELQAMQTAAAEAPTPPSETPPTAPPSNEPLPESGEDPPEVAPTPAARRKKRVI